MDATSVLVLLLALLLSILRISIPYVMAALGGTVSERAGVVNIALEGFLLMAALGTGLGAPHGALVAFLCGLLFALATSGLYALLAVVLRGDPIVCGVGIFLLADGLCRFLLKVAYDSTSNSPRFPTLDEGSGGRFYLLTFLLLAAILPVALHLLLSRTVFGLRLRAVGEHPKAARSLSISVTKVRIFAVLLSGALCSLGGIWLVFDQRQLVALMSGGRGFIALAAMIFGGWRPLHVALASLLFGAAEAIGISLQAQGLSVPNWLVQLLPYTLTIAALTLRGVLGKGRALQAPAALSQPLE